MHARAALLLGMARVVSEPPATAACRPHCRWLHGLQMQLVDGALFLQVRYLMFGLQQRLRGHLSFVRLQDALRHGFPDAAPDRLQADACPICLETMRVRGRLAAAGGAC